MYVVRSWTSVAGGGDAGGSGAAAGFFAAGFEATGAFLGVVFGFDGGVWAEETTANESATSVAATLRKNMRTPWRLYATGRIARIAAWQGKIARRQVTS